MMYLCPHPTCGVICLLTNTHRPQSVRPHYSPTTTTHTHTAAAGQAHSSTTPSNLLLSEKCSEDERRIIYSEKKFTYNL